MKKILITGPLGQDGTILTELLNGEYDLYGICRTNSDIKKVTDFQKKFDIKLSLIDLKDFSSVNKVINKINPDVIVNFAGETNVIKPFDNVVNTFEDNFLIPLNLLNSIVKNGKDIFLFQSSSSLMYGRSHEKIITEVSNFAPLYPYGISKLSTHNLLKEYRENYGLKCSSGIFFNHESTYRNDGFVTKKISNLIKKILNGESQKIKLFGLNYYRDISHAKDFMGGVKMIIDNNYNEDFIFSSGELTNLLNLSKRFFKLYNLDFDNYIEYEENKILNSDYSIIGDNTKLKSFGWKPNFTIDDLIYDMVNN